MITAIPNPKKSLTLERPIQEVNQALEHIPLYNKKYTLFKYDKLLNHFTYDASEFLSLGVYIDVNTTRQGEGTTEVTVEVRRKVGSFDQSVEITNANNHITKIFELLSESIQSDPTEKLAAVEKLKQEKELKNKYLEEKERLEREKNPMLYKIKNALYTLLFLGIGGGVAYFIFSLFKK